LQGGDVRGEWHSHIKPIDHVEERSDQRFTGREVRVVLVFPPAVVSVEVSCDDNMFVVQDVIVWEGAGEIVVYFVHCFVVVAVVVHVYHGDRARVRFDTNARDIGASELELFVAICW